MYMQTVLATKSALSLIHDRQEQMPSCQRNSELATKCGVRSVYQLVRVNWHLSFKERVISFLFKKCVLGNAKYNFTFQTAGCEWNLCYRISGLKWLFVPKAIENCWQKCHFSLKLNCHLIHHCKKNENMQPLLLSHIPASCRNECKF